MTILIGCKLSVFIVAASLTGFTDFYFLFYLCFIIQRPVNVPDGRLFLLNTETQEKKKGREREKPKAAWWRKATTRGLEEGAAG